MNNTESEKSLKLYSSPWSSVLPQTPAKSKISHLETKNYNLVELFKIIVLIK